MDEKQDQEKKGRIRGPMIAVGMFSIGAFIGAALQYINPPGPRDLSYLYPLGIEYRDLNNDGLTDRIIQVPEMAGVPPTYQKQYAYKKDDGSTIYVTQSSLERALRKYKNIEKLGIEPKSVLGYDPTSPVASQADCIRAREFLESIKR